MRQHPSHKILIEQDKAKLWRIVARPTTRWGLQHEGAIELCDRRFETPQAARPDFDAVIRYRKREVAL